MVIVHITQQTIARPKKKRILSHNLDNIKQLRCASISEGFFKPPPLPELIDDSCFKDGLPEPLIPGNAHQDFCSSFLGLKPTAKQATKIKQIRRLKLFLGHAQPMKLKKRSLNRISEVKDATLQRCESLQQLAYPPYPFVWAFHHPELYKKLR